MESPQQWQAWNEDGGIVVRLDDAQVVVELICDTTQRRYLRQCALTAYFSEAGHGDCGPLREAIAAEMDEATVVAIDAAVRARLPVAGD
ncbi:MAG: hypothetical protein MUE46_03725 [Xanthomonadales bacterium]|jgi:hypothetical protein|nr:hypothetical protein [Xanthomonadales bacterium]